VPASDRLTDVGSSRHPTGPLTVHSLPAHLRPRPSRGVTGQLHHDPLTSPPPAHPLTVLAAHSRPRPSLGVTGQSYHAPITPLPAAHSHIFLPPCAFMSTPFERSNWKIVSSPSNATADGALPTVLPEHLCPRPSRGAAGQSYHDPLMRTLQHTPILAALRIYVRALP
jgi:hypothetical protein